MKRGRGTRCGSGGGTKFPGEIAGASLKPEGEAERVRGGDPKFPGEIAGASLKRRVALALPTLSTGNSPAKSPGPH